MVSEIFEGEDLIAKFQLGEIILSKGVRESVGEVDQMLTLNRHAQGDWGCVSEEDARANDNAFFTSERIFSVYRTAEGVEFWVITEANRQYTNMLLPFEY